MSGFWPPRKCRSVETAVEKGIAMIATVKIKCVNGNHPVFSRDCPTWKKEKAILKVKYEKSITFPEAQKLVEDQFAAPCKSYASIT